MAYFFVVAFVVVAVGCSELIDSEAGKGASATTEAAHSFQSARHRPMVLRSVAGDYTLELGPEKPDARRGALHNWRVRVRAANGSDVSPTRLTFSGGMPQHGHGFQSAPQVTEAIEGGWYRIEGVRFHMAGQWALRVEVVSEGKSDVALVEIDVPY